ncbi:hypothetical protein AYO49_01740 [Verrucomicrobiaceae bacterium SCGC AG-212-N21]|nr:hypothetical protein AYO49_01740 [Verrucomicrobiaceae bacterium SCGC AG-212-N21]
MRFPITALCFLFGSLFGISSLSAQAPSKPNPNFYGLTYMVFGFEMTEKDAEALKKFYNPEQKPKEALERLADPTNGKLATPVLLMMLNTASGQRSVSRQGLNSMEFDPVIGPDGIKTDSRFKLNTANGELAPQMLRMSFGDTLYLGSLPSPSGRVVLHFVRPIRQ